VESHPEYEYLGLNILDDSSGAEGFVRKYGWTWPSLVDPDAKLAGRLGLFGHPAVALLDENGVVVARHLGGGDGEAWSALAEEL
jgi:hypothetical protein